MTLETFMTVYLVVGVVIATGFLYILRNSPASFLRIVLDYVNCTLFWPYILQLNLATYQSYRRARKVYLKELEEYKKNPEAYTQKTEEMMNQLLNNLKELQNTDDKNDKTGVS